MPRLFLTATGGPGGIARHPHGVGAAVCALAIVLGRVSTAGEPGTERAVYWWKDPVRRPPAPDLPGAAGDWARNPIDAFILARLLAAGLAPAPPADPRELLRRVTFDLTGLPPTPGEMEAFLADRAPDAYEKVVDRLIASPRHGERWGRHWLDLVRFAESNGYERDGAKANAWKYRDYVVRAFNEDRPYDRFIIEQLAGDEVEDGGFDGLVATGYYRLGSWDDEPDDAEAARYDELDDIIRTTGTAFLGLTVNCARCHDHKFDAIRQVDYYRFLAFFEGIRHADDLPLAPEDGVRRWKVAEAAARERVKALEEEIKALVKSSGAPKEEELSGDAKSRRDELRRKIEETKRSVPPMYPVAMGIREAGDPPRTRLLVRGNPRDKGEEVEPGHLRILASMSPTIEKPRHAASSGRRLALARSIASPGNLLTSRVMANRVWQFHFGRGIVRSSSDFGTMGDRPTHPELLDWLAAELVEGGWRLKRLHRLIVTSSAYRTSSRIDDEAARIDPGNDLFSRMDLRRLEAEAIRDSILAVNGSLRHELGGPSVFPRIPGKVLHTQSRPGDGWGKSDRQAASRRSVYVFVKRSLVLPILESFDFADTGQTCARRTTTTIAPQALTLMNGEFVHEEALAFADRLIAERGESLENQVDTAWRLSLGRRPRESEAREALALVERERAALEERGEAAGEARRRALAALCLVIYNLNEFIYID